MVKKVVKAAFAAAVAPEFRPTEIKILRAIAVAAIAAAGLHFGGVA